MYPIVQFACSKKYFKNKFSINIENTKTFITFVVEMGIQPKQKV
jgi:hypothetical protein